MPQLPPYDVLGLGGPGGAPERRLAPAHADRAGSADPAEKRRTGRSGDDREVGFGQALKDQLREREPATDAAAPQGDALPEGGKASPPLAEVAAGAALEAAAMAGFVPLPALPQPAPDAAKVEKALSAGDDRTGAGAQRGLIAMLQRHAGAGANDAMPAPLRALANALATTSAAAETASFAAPTENRGVADGVPATQTPAAHTAATTPATPTSPPLPAMPGDPARMPVLDVDAPVGHPAWRDSVGHHVTWMADQGIGRAELRLHPAHLGPIEVKVSVQNDQVNVSFHASHAATREALESSLPRLRELLGDSGLSLGQASVSQQFAGGERTPERAASADQRDGLRVDPSTQHIEAQVATRVRVGLLDAYA